MPTDDPHHDDGVGSRVRAARKLAGLTQRQLADRAHVSVSLVRQVEQSRVPASPAFIAATARALNLGPTDLTAQPYQVNDRLGHHLHQVIPALRRELAAYRLPPHEGISPRATAALATAVAAASQLRHAVNLDSLGAELPGLLAELRAAVHHRGEHEQEQLFGLLAEAYTAARVVAYKLGYADLATVATERIEWAAQQSGDPLAIAAGNYYVASDLIASAEWHGTITYLEQARGRIADQVRTGEQAALALHGILHLKSGLAAARAGDTDTADTHLAEARHAAQHVTPGSDHYRFAFDVDNVNIWAVGLAVEARDGTKAITRADGLRFTTAPRERVGHHWIDLARGWQLHGDHDRALRTLHQARLVTPQQVRHHPQVRETLITLAHHHKRRSDTLTRFARWAGIQL